MPEFETPSFLKNLSENEIFAKIKEILPEKFDLSEGSHGYNLTFPIALVGAEICEFVLPEVLKLIIPEWSYGEFLVGHAKGRGMTPKAAVAATGEITITGDVNLLIPAGSVFSVPAMNNEPSVDYATTEDVTIPSSGSVTAGVECTQAGIVGNTGANTIVLVSSKLTGITAVTNEEEITGGAEQESDESLIERISEYDKTQGYSFVGNEADYKRWAMSVPGVGNATVLGAEDDSGIVTIILTDENGDPATETLKDSVYNYIMRPDNREARLAPTGALLSVVAPETCNIGIKATVELEENYTIEAVKTKFASVLALYLTEAMDEGEVKYSRIWAVLAGVDGVADFKDLQIGAKTDSDIIYGTINIPISDKQLPVVESEDLLLTAGNV